MQPKSTRSPRRAHPPISPVTNLSAAEWSLIAETADWERLSRIVQFWSKVDRSGGEDACWPWTASTVGSHPHGMVKWDSNAMVAARVVYEMTYGPIPSGLWVVHNCPSGDNALCVNPRHLFLGTAQDNVADMISKRRHQHGEKSSRAKLTEAQVRAIYQRHKEGGITQKQLAQEYGVSSLPIYRIVHGLGWRHLNLRDVPYTASEID